MEYVLLKNQIIHREEAYISFHDRGYHFGDGIYEVIRIYNGTPFLWEEHFNRFLRSAKELDIDLPQSLGEIKDNILTLLSKNDVRNGTVYLQMTRGEQERNHLYRRDLTPILTAFTKEGNVPISQQENGIGLWALEDIRWLRCDIKTINLLGNVMSKRKAEDQGYQEALLHRGHIVTEGSSTNVFMVKNEILYTHPANHYILNGITRLLVEQLADKEQFSLQKEAFTLEDVKQADEMFVTSTTLEIVPVTKIQGSIETNFSIGPVTRQLQQAFKQTTAV
ncbi:D-amino-acid transaminase [Salibacterium salarium]|uniref:D-alanine aminotransferase n=1 Tax=Salibacterium salarium TaxID=284579 RepID=A0A3R9QP57_9BACI|nr:D-amino-acid transaminase [Salibacterium salarium]RSL34545.1 D-amino-acid transaminase [Salibacterium salarium]